MDRAAVTIAVRRLAWAEGREATVGALEHLERMSALWRERLSVAPRDWELSERGLERVLEAVTGVGV